MWCFEQWRFVAFLLYKSLSVVRIYRNRNPRFPILDTSSPTVSLLFRSTYSRDRQNTGIASNIFEWYIVTTHVTTEHRCQRDTRVHRCNARGTWCTQLSVLSAPHEFKSWVISLENDENWRPNSPTQRHTNLQAVTHDSSDMCQCGNLSWFRSLFAQFMAPVSKVITDGHFSTIRSISLIL